VAVEQRRIRQFLRDFAVKARRGGEVKEDVFGYVAFSLYLDDLLSHILAEALIIPLSPGEADDRERFRQHPLASQAI
jgi:hypothetical protein